MTTATEVIAEWASEKRARGFDDEVLETAQIFVIDWLANALAGRGTEPGRAILDYTRSQPAGSALVVGETTGRSAEAAAFANGALSHIVEMDDVDRLSVVHPGAVVIPAAFAIQGREGKSGRAFLSAVVAGFEVAIRFGSAVGAHHYRHFHNTSTCGVFGAAMASGWLLELDAEACTWALGSAGTMAFGLWEFNSDGSMSKHLHTGHAASSGLRAADLAARGFTGAQSIVEGERGFFAALAPEGEPDRVTAGLGEAPLALPAVSLKPYASCRHTHAAIDAAKTIREELHGRQVERATIFVYRAAADLCDNPSPKTTYEAKFSLQYCVAHALAGRPMGLEDFDAAGDVALSVNVATDPDLTARFPTQFPARLSVELTDGETLEKEVAFPLGDPENPLTRAHVEAKFLELAIYGGATEEEARGHLDWANRLLERVPT